MTQMRKKRFQFNSVWESGRKDASGGISGKKMACRLYGICPISLLLMVWALSVGTLTAQTDGENVVSETEKSAAASSPEPQKLQVAVRMVREGDCERALPLFTELESELKLSESQAAEAFPEAADYWFFRAVAEHQTFRKEACFKSLDRLQALSEMADSAGKKFVLPARFAALARLMRKDLELLQDESIEMISRRMRNVERRLGAGAAGKKVQQSEEEIVKMLDSMIDEMEQQARKQKSRSSQSLRPGKPMNEARIAGGKGPGNVTRRELKFNESWGKLPEKEREAVLQQLGRDFPPHYRDAIEQYFKRMAEQE